MELALYTPGLGYYSAWAHKFGKGGDFITAPERSPLFSAGVATAIAPALRQAGKGAVFMELGGGSGAFAESCLLALQDIGVLPARYAMLEPSADLRQRQRERLQAQLPAELFARVEWLDGPIAEIWNGVLFANEKSEEYSEFSRHYGGLLVSIKNERLLNELKDNLDKIISSYQVGSQSNPVGYSGLLGLKGVRNRIEGSLYELNLKVLNSKSWINTKTEMAEDWTPDLSENLKDFLITKLSSSNSSLYSSMLLAQELKVSSLENVKDMEKARHLPRVGLFAQTNIYSGDRDTANAQAYGIYLAWDIFNSDSYGRVGEATAKFRASEAKIEAGKKEEKIMRDQLLDSKSTLEKSLVLIEDSDKILKEQTSNAMRLFRSGMLNALQLAEVINRRVDLIENKYKIESQYLDVSTRIYQLNN